jgi:hypothetical protein
MKSKKEKRESGETANPAGRQDRLRAQRLRAQRLRARPK